jgi:nucleoside-triphosphatase
MELDARGARCDRKSAAHRPSRLRQDDIDQAGCKYSGATRWWFYTEKIRDGGTRAGFKLVTLDGNEAVFAHVDLKTPEHLGKYRLDLSALERIGVGAVREAIRPRRLVVIDEIGPMEIRSAIFGRQ